jgi:hypothetical protein
MNMKQNISFLGVLALSLIFTGCSTYGFKTPLGENTYSPVDYHKVQLLFGVSPRPYQVIGVVSVDGGVFASYGDMCRKLVKSAAVLGADAVIVTGEGNNQAIIPGVSTSYNNCSAYGSATATAYGNTVNAYGNGSYSGTTTTYASPTYIANMPTNKGLAIKFTN